MHSKSHKNLQRHMDFFFEYLFVPFTPDCDFENDMCGWKNARYNTINWSRRKLRTHTNEKGLVLSVFFVFQSLLLHWLDILLLQTKNLRFLIYFVSWFDLKIQKRDLGVITSLAWYLYTSVEIRPSSAVNMIQHIVEFYAPREYRHLEDFCPIFWTIVNRFSMQRTSR